MVCGFGEQVGYETLVKKIAREQVDKSSRFTDWSRRPLTDAQKTYAIGDVTHLRQVYEFLAKKLEENNRSHWVQEELGILTNPDTYTIKPIDAWKRVKTRTSTAKFMAVVQMLAAFREEYAQSRNVPRNRVYKDDALVELASNKPKTMEDLSRSRLLLREARRGDIADGILAAVVKGVGMPADRAPKPVGGREKLQVNPALADLLRVLLKAKTESAGVAAKLIASAADLDAMAGGMRNVAAVSGWRAEVFGEDALRLCEGKIALAAVGNDVKVVPLD
jgi:ribonuclease D